MDPVSDRVVTGPAAGIRFGEVEESRQHPQVGGREPGVGGDVVGDGSEGDGRLGLGPAGRTFPPSGPRDRGRRGAPGCKAVHGCSPCSPARSRAWNAGAARIVRNWATRRARSSGESGPQRRVGAAWGEISVKGSEWPLHWAQGWL